MSRRAVNVPRHMTKKLNMMTQMARNKDPQRSGAIALEAANLSCIMKGKAVIVVVVKAPVSATSICTSGSTRIMHAQPKTMKVRMRYVCHQRYDSNPT